jgi:DNA recombination protein RmuC|tara:strand:- start:121 stop:678 length:558 start_codon:yes stop_codon:yes gene_type:complete
VRDILPPSAYEFQAAVGENRCADCLIRLPNPPGAIVVDAKFPLESYYVLRDADDTTISATQHAFRDAVGKHIVDIVERSYRQRVWIVSPTTLMATFNTVRAVLKDAHTREQAGVIQEEVLNLVNDLGRLDKRVGNLEKHFDQAVRDIRISSNKISSRGERIVTIEIGDGEDEVTEALAPPAGTDQ